MKKLILLAILSGGLFTAGAQSDNPCGSPSLPVNSTCVNTAGNLPSSATNTTGIPAPGCASYSGPDVWYSITVPASGSITVTMNTASGGPTDMGMALYSGSCSSMSLIECDDDDGPGLMPSITRTGLTAGSTIWVRIWEYGGGSFGAFNICVQEITTTACTPPGANGTCAGATPFCSGPAVNYCNTTGVSSLGGGGIYGCLGSTPNPAFFYLHIGSSGPIDILITQSSTTGTPLDVDFVCWGPFSTQAAMCPGMSASTIIDCSYSASATETVNIPSAVAGQWYLLLITNFSGVSGSVTYQQTGGTGATDCSITTPCSVSGTPANISCFGGTGSIAVNATGSGPYTINLLNASGTTVATQSGAGPSFNFTGLAAGTYTLNASATGSSPACTSTATVTITGPTAALSASSSHTDVLCSGGCSGTLSASATGGTSPYTYSWSGGLGAGANKTSVCPGTYTVTITDANGCTATSTQTVVDPSFTLSTSSSDELCGGSNGAVSAVATPATGTVTLTWYSDAGMTAAIGSGSPVTGLPGGTYYLNATSTTGCVSNTTVVVNSPSVPVLTLTVDANATGFGLCNGSATGTVTGGIAPLTYSWTDGDAGSTDSTLCAGVQCLTVTDANGCTDDSCVTITEPDLLVVSLTGINPLCFGSCDGSITSSTTGGVPPYSFSWSNGATTSDISASCAGSYTLTVTDNNGNTATASQTLTDPAPLVVSPAVTSNVTCNAACNGTISVTASGGTGTLMYNIPGLTGGPSYTSVCAGSYVLTVTDSNGCFVSQNINISQPPALSISMSSVNASCVFPNGSASANVTGGVAPYSYLWSNGATSAVNSGITSGTYSVTVTDANGCTISGTTVVGNNPPLVIDAGIDQTICFGKSTLITATASGGSGGPYTFTWMDQTGAPVASVSTANSTTVNVTPADSMYYYVTVDDGCAASVSTDTVAVFVNPLPQLSFTASNPAGCSPFTTDIVVNTDIGQRFYYDFQCDGIVDQNSETASITYTYNQAGTYDVCVTVESQYGCTTSGSMAGLVTAYPLPVANFSFTPVSASILTPEITFINLSTGVTSYTWNFGDSTGASGNAGSAVSSMFTSGIIEQPEHTYQDTGTYVVTLQVENVYGCTDVISHTVVIEPDFEIFAPNAFTPNGDGTNEIFLPTGIGFDPDSYELYIFDRWGNAVFKSTSFASGWDGTHNGIKCKSDVYVWKILVRDFKRIKHTYTGTITLLR